MTRANLNFVWQDWGSSPKTLYFYYNGDQYPSGLRDHFRIKEWLAVKRVFTSNGFKGWIKKNYSRDGEKARPILITHPAIHYDDAGFPTDYSYIFEKGMKNPVKVYNWDERIFRGTVEQFITWLDKRPQWH